MKIALTPMLKDSTPLVRRRVSFIRNPNHAVNYAVQNFNHARVTNYAPHLPQIDLSSHWPNNTLARESIAHSTTLDAKPDRVLKSYLCRIILRMPKKYSATVRCVNTKTIAQPPSCTRQLGSLRCILASTPPCFALRK